MIRYFIVVILILPSILFGLENNNGSIKTADTEDEVMEIVQKNKITTDNDEIVEISISNFRSSSKEIVYYPLENRKISELTWESENIKVLGINLEYYPLQDVKLYFNIKRKIFSDDGYMSDYDWAYSSMPNIWTDRSVHPDTQVTKLQIIDLGASKSFDFGSDNFKLFFNMGYKHEKHQYEARNGSYVYSDWSAETIDNLRIYEGDFNGLGITYTQELKGFYLGATTEFQFGDFTLNLDVKYSNKINAHYTDRHHFRYFNDKTTFDDTSMLTYKVGLDYKLKKHHSLGIAYEQTKYDYVRGDRVRSYDDGTNWDLPDSVAMESDNKLVTLSYQYNF